jgi:hypothetical protein
MTKHWIIGVGALVTALASGACSGEDEPTVVEEVFSESCADVCERWDECRGPIDLDNCIDECEDASESEVGDDYVDDCDACVEDGSCQEIDSCWATCPQFPSMR